MKMPKRGEKGFTLIELLIVVAILGVLAAIVIPNVGRFIGRGEDEAKDTEFANIQSAVISMMTDNGLSTLAHPVDGSTYTRTRDMSSFPDRTDAVDKGTDADGEDFTAADKYGFVLYQHDIDANGENTTLVNYVATQTTSYWYTVDSVGTITQWPDDGS